MQRCRPVLIPGVWIHTGSQQRGRHQRILAIPRNMQGRFTPDILSAGVGAAIYECSDNRGIAAPACGPMQGSSPQPGLRVRIGPGVNQAGDQLGLSAICCCLVKGTNVVVIHRLRIRPRVQQGIQYFRFLAESGP